MLGKPKAPSTAELPRTLGRAGSRGQVQAHCKPAHRSTCHHIRDLGMDTASGHCLFILSSSIIDMAGYESSNKDSQEPADMFKADKQSMSHNVMSCGPTPGKAS